MTTILGIDPGLAKTGYGVIRVEGSKIVHVTHSTISTEPSTDTGRRLQKIYRVIAKVIEEFKPDVSAVESLYFAKNISSAFPVAQARGVVLLSLAEADIEAHEFPPQEIKQAITGNGRARKSQVQELVRFLLALEEVPKPDHAADALAAAICCFHTISAEKKISSGDGKSDD